MCTSLAPVTVGQASSPGMTVSPYFARAAGIKPGACGRMVKETWPQRISRDLSSCVMVNAALKVVVQLTELLVDLVGSKDVVCDSGARWVSRAGVSQHLSLVWDKRQVSCGTGNTGGYDGRRVWFCGHGVCVWGW